MDLGSLFHCFYCENLWQASEELFVGDKVWGGPTIHQISCWDKKKTRTQNLL